MHHSAKLEIKGNDSEIDVDPTLLFQRLSAIMLGNRNYDLDLSWLFTFELRPYPASLPRSTESLNIPAKPSLVERLTHLSIVKLSNQFDRTKTYVLDGGYLLRTTVEYRNGATFGDIARKACDEVLKKYGKCIPIPPAME